MDELRYTPAGEPVVKFVLRHDSRQAESGRQAAAKFDLAVVAYGDIALAHARVARGDAIAVKGFLAARSNRGSSVVLHASRIKWMNGDLNATPDEKRS